MGAGTLAAKTVGLISLATISVFGFEYCNDQIINGHKTKSIRVVDVNGDNIPDIVLTENNGRYELFRGTKEGTYVPLPEHDIKRERDYQGYQTGVLLVKQTNGLYRPLEDILAPIKR